MKLAGLDAVTLDAYGTLVTLADPVPKLMDVLAERGVERSEQAVLAGFRTEVAHYAPRASEGHASLRGLDLLACGLELPCDKLGNVADLRCLHCGKRLHHVVARAQ